VGVLVIAHSRVTRDPDRLQSCVPAIYTAAGDV